MGTDEPIVHKVLREAVKTVVAEGHSLLLCIVMPCKLRTVCGMRDV